ncbi:DUF3107 domain-containing protein [Corynebacterium aquatimens]|uniref:ATP-binding protein n=1 Tax=Corynebacterium aquatimens TaxID=1190508 RepID=A0A931E3X5_9CORY|nr:DUF3107 domain-containing protein [Corynebacterium aquatimens]MBG6123175.1 hypothetical protein [Corynebacterium aquatimens]WJY66494.1 hypothetical protein CAQUA_09035 [Corynebacterium aquatimens]
MELKIGLVDSPRELSVTSSADQADVEGQIVSAIESGDATVTFEDERGMRFVVRTDRINYVELGTSSQRTVGFGGA